MWMDGKDTIYFVGWEEQLSDSIAVYKWGAGPAAPQRVGAFIPGNNGSTPPHLTMDVQGNIYVVDGEDPYFFEFTRTSTIDSAYTPTATGRYYAVVTDIRGYAVTTNTIVISDPLTGPPSIQISATAASTNVCTPITFTAEAANGGIYPSYQWEVSGVRVGGDSTTYSNNLFANGDHVLCILTAQGCTGPVIDTSNVTPLSVDPQGAASVTISTPKDSICEGDTVGFAATVTNGSNNPGFQWLLNGINTGDDSATYVRDNFNNGDVITCLITSDDVCGLAKSNSIPLLVSIPPTVQPGQVFTIPYGQSLTLNPAVSGDTTSYSYLWSPSTGLSNSIIENPVADPSANTLYTLKVSAPGGCTASGSILVNVYTPLSIPGAFTPNGDGHNDLFYVLGDPTYAWNGTFHGSPTPAGTYVYLIVMQLAGGSRQTYKGTVILIR
jgi:hypothetical protein